MNIRDIIYNFIETIENCDDLDIIFETTYLYLLDNNHIDNTFDISNVIDIILDYYSDNNTSVEKSSISSDVVDLQQKNEKTEQEIYLENRVIELQSREQYAQRSLGWYNHRNKMFTASSDIKNILDGGKSLIETILKKLGHDLHPFNGNIYTRWGVKYEQVATQIYSHKNNVKILEFGLLQSENYPFIGASPDGITPSGIMLEIKCPSKRIITGVVPHYYWIQVQVQLSVCKLDEADFIELRFQEYSTEEQYLLDTSSEYKGILGELYECSCNFNICGCSFNPDNRKYLYPPLHINDNEKKEWIDKEFLKCVMQSESSQPMLNELPRRIKFLKYNYWYLDTYSCVRIKRDSAWWNNIIPIVENAWKDVEKYRLLGDAGIEELKHKLIKKNNVVYIDLDVDINNTSLFSDSDEEN